MHERKIRMNGVMSHRLTSTAACVRQASALQRCDAGVRVRVLVLVLGLGLGLGLRNGVRVERWMVD